MSRRKQSRPQHLDHDDDMPGTDIKLASTKISSAVTSSSPQIKFELEEKICTSAMTQSASREEENLRQTAPSKVVADDAEGARGVSPREKMSEREETVTSGRADLSPKASDSVVSKSSKSASCGSLNVGTIKDEDMCGKFRRVSADAVDYSKVKSEPHHSSDGLNGQHENGGSTGLKAIPAALSISEIMETKRRTSCPSHLGSADKNSTSTNKYEASENRLEQVGHRESAPYQHVHGMMTPMIALERKHECEKCGVSFRSKTTYDVHVKHYCSGKRHDAECKICGAKFDSKKRLTIHMEDHSPQYLCLICNERMCQPEDCRNHMAVHANFPETSRRRPKPETFPCPGCELRCTKRSDLVGHLCIHHVTTANLMPFFYPPTPTGLVGSSSYGIMNTAMQQEENDKTERSEFEDKSRQVDSIPEVRSPLHSSLDEAELRNMSPPVTTSTPTRPLSTKEEPLAGIKQPFSCIVCSLAFPDVVELQRHLLTSHTSVTADAASQNQAQAPKPLERDTNRKNYRKMSTVSPPKLSMLYGTIPRKISEPSRPEVSEKQVPSALRRVSTYSPIHSQTPTTEGGINGKKRKERNCNNSGSTGDLTTASSSSLKRIKRDEGDAVPSSKPQDIHGEDKYEARRISCPVVSHKLMESDHGLLTACYASSEEERTCVQCDIKFCNAANYRAHKKYYCATRHIHKTPDEGQIDFMSAPSREPSDTGEVLSSAKLRKRNAGNRSSMTSRKRSHLIPLETVRGLSPVRDSTKATAKSPSVRKSCPSDITSSPHSDVIKAQTSSPSRNTSPQTPPVLTKRHLCQECNIWFSKYDTYLAHKKFYCESRRKDRGGQRVVHNKVPLKRKSESSLREPISMVDNSAYPSDHRRLWSPQQKSPSTDGDDHAPVESEDSEGPQNDKQKRNMFDNATLPFPAYSPMNHEMLTRMSFMQPLIINQYLTLLRERMAQGLCSNGFLLPTLPVVNLPGSGSSLTTARAAKRSLDETKNNLSQPSGSSAEIDSASRPQSPPQPPPRSNSGSITKVKQEPGVLKSDDTASRLRTSPLDLSNKSANDVQSDPKDDVGCESHPTYSCPTIDLRTTAFALVKREPQSDFPSGSPERDSTPAAAPDNNNGNNNKTGDQMNGNVSPPASRIAASQPLILQMPSQDGAAPPQKSRAQHCKNCDARFTSLSTFIAHKKYYCSASNSNTLLCSDAKAAQMAH